MTRDTLIKKISRDIYRKRFFLEQLALFHQELEERIIFLYPIDEQYKPVGKSHKNKYYYLGILDNYKLCLLEIWKDKNQKIQIQKPVFCLDIRFFLNSDILKVKITNFIGLRIELYGNEFIPHVNLDIIYYMVEKLIPEKEIENNTLCKTISFPLSQLFDGKFVFEYTYREPKEGHQGVAKTEKKIIPNINRYICRNDIYNINIGRLNEDFKSIGIQVNEPSHSLILKNWNPKKSKTKKIPGNINNKQIISIYSDENHIYVSCENENIYQLKYFSDQFKIFRPGNNLFARSLLKIGDYLFTALSNRTIGRIDLNSSQMDFHKLDSEPIFMAPFESNKIIVTTNQKQLLIFKVNKKIEPDELKVYKDIGKTWQSKAELQSICLEILKKEILDESQIASLEFAVYTWLELNPTDVFTPLRSLIYTINKYFRHKPNKGLLILKFIQHCQNLIFSDYQKYSLLLKEFYISSCDKYRSDFLELIQKYYRDIKNELDFICWNNSSEVQKSTEELVNQFGLFWFYKDGFFIEYSKTFSPDQLCAIDTTHQPSIAYFCITHHSKNSQKIAIIDSQVPALLFIDKNHFKKNVSQKFIPLNLTKKSKIRKIELDNEEKYLFYADETQNLKIFPLDQQINDEALSPTIISLNDMCWDMVTHPFNYLGQSYILVVMGFKSSGLNIYIFDYNKPNHLQLLYSHVLRNEWIRNLDFTVSDHQNNIYEIAAVGSERKRLYHITFHLNFNDDRNTFEIIEKKIQIKKFDRPLYCVKLFIEKNFQRFFLVGSDQGILYFLNDDLQIQWQQELKDSIRTIKICHGKSETRKEIIVGVGNGDIFFLSSNGFLLREIRFGKPLLGLDVGLLDSLKGKTHIITCIENQFVIYEINREALEKKILITYSSYEKNCLLDNIEKRISNLCGGILRSNLDPGSPILILAETLTYYYQWESVTSLLNTIKSSINNTSDYYLKDKSLFLQSLGNLIDHARENNFTEIQKIIEFINTKFGNDKDIQWKILKFYQKIFQNFRTKDKFEFLDQIDYLVKSQDSNIIKPVYAQSQWLLDNIAIVFAQVLRIDEKNIMLIINDLLAQNMPHQIYDSLARYFNHHPVFEFLFSLYCELDKTPAADMITRFSYFINQLAQKEDTLIKAGIKNIAKLIRFYKQVLKAIQIDSFAEMQHFDIDMDITSPLYELEGDGFKIRPLFKELFQTFQQIDFKPIEKERYFIKKIQYITEIQLVLKQIIFASSDSFQVGNKLIFIIASHWNRILDQTLDEYRSTIKINIKLKEKIVENISLNSSFLIFENLGGTTARETVIIAISAFFKSITKGLIIGDIPPGPGNEIQVGIKELLTNPSQTIGDFSIKIEINYKDDRKISRKSITNFDMSVLSSSKFIKENKWKQYCEINPDLFNYFINYPQQYQKATEKILSFVNKQRGLIFLQGEEGVGRSSLLIHLSLFLEPEIKTNTSYIRINPKIRKILRKKDRFKTILHQILEIISPEKIEIKNEIKQYLENIKKILKLSNEVNILFINNLEQLKIDSFIEFFQYLEEISQFAVIVAAVDRNMIRLLKYQLKDKHVLNISTISKKDQENFFKHKMGNDFQKMLPSNWKLLVGNHVYSTYLMARALKIDSHKKSLNECLDEMLLLYSDEKKKGKTDYYFNVWNTLSLNEKLLVYICAKEHISVPLDDLKPGLFIGSHPFLVKSNFTNYRIIVKVKDGNEYPLKNYYLKENQILDSNSIDYLQRARDRIHLKGEKKGLFPVKIQNEETLLKKNHFSRVILANFLSEKGRLEKKLEELMELGILRKVKIGGEFYYCHNDYIFLIYLLRSFENYEQLIPKRELITAYTLNEIHYAVNTFKREDKEERSQFIKFLGVDEQRLKRLEELFHYWHSFKLDTPVIQNLYQFLEYIFYLDSTKEHPTIQIFDHFCEKFFKFKIQIMSKFTHVILIIIPNENSDITQLDIRLQSILDYYKLFTGTELIFIITLFDRRKLKLELDKFNLNIVILDENSLKKYIQAEKKELELLQQISNFLDLRILSPYRYTKGVAGDMFVGRKKELDTIFKKPDTDFAIFGERKIGKTSLLKQIEYQCKERISSAYIYPIFVDLFQVCTSQGFFERLNNCLKTEQFFKDSKEISIKNMKDFEALLVRFLNRDNRTRLIFLFDEVDDLYANSFITCRNCSAKKLVTLENYEKIQEGFKCSFCNITSTPYQMKSRDEIEAVHSIFASFRSISQIYDRCQFIFTGFKILFNLHRHYGSEFINFTQPLDLGKLDYEDLKSLILEPMKRLNINFQGETEILERLNDYSLKGIPWIIQFYCNYIIEKLAHTAEPVVTTQLIDEISIEVKPQIKKSLDLTITTSREIGLMKLIQRFRQEMTNQSGIDEFRVEDLIAFQEMLSIGPDQQFKKVELEYYLDLFSRCFFLNRELKIKGKQLKPQYYYQLILDPYIFDIQ